MHCYQTLETTAIHILRHNPAWLTTLPLPAGVLPVDAKGTLAVITKIVSNDRPTTLASDLLARRLAEIARTDRDAMTVLLAAMSRRLRNRFRSNATDDYHTDGLAVLAILLLEANLDRSRFAVKVQEAVAVRSVPPKTWVNYCDHHLAHELTETGRSATDRVRACRAITVFQPFIKQHLISHAALPTCQRGFALRAIQQVKLLVAEVFLRCCARTVRLTSRKLPVLR